jgi:hypothetical protein
MLRKQFDDWVPFASPLRNLATEIAQLEAAIWPDFLARTGSNLLSRFTRTLPLFLFCTNLCSEGQMHK